MSVFLRLSKNTCIITVTIIFLVYWSGCNKICTVCYFKSTYINVSCIISNSSCYLKKVCCITMIPPSHIRYKLSCCKISLVFYKYNTSWICIPVVYCYYFIAICPDKLVEGMTYIAISNIHYICKWVRYLHLIYINLNSYICLMMITIWWLIHRMTCSYQKISVRFCHSQTSCIKWNISITVI